MILSSHTTSQEDGTLTISETLAPQSLIVRVDDGNMALEVTVSREDWEALVRVTEDYKFKWASSPDEPT